MKAIIAINQSDINNTPVQTVNARELHAYLEVRHHFRDWIKNRIEEYGFEDGKDFCLFFSESTGGRPTKEYAISLDMAKELSMVERNARGKQARQYFIECERQAKQAAPVLPAAKQSVEAARMFPAFFRIARLIGCDRNAAAISANQYVRKLTNTNLLEGLGHTHLVAENQTSLPYTPTELGQQLGGVSARQVNRLLAAAGLQTKAGTHWQPTPAARAFVRLFDTGKRHSDGTPVTQIKWSADVLPLLQAA